MALFPAVIRDAADWRHRAFCRGVDPEIFFPVGEPADPFDERNLTALALCAACPVRAQCLAEALDRIPDGVVGGMTAGQRRDYRAHVARRAAPATAPAATPSPAAVPAAPEPERVPVPAPRPRRRPAATGTDGTSPRKATRAVGVGLLDAGEPWRKIAEQLDVSYRTVERWAAWHGTPRPPFVRPRLHPLSAKEARRMGGSAPRRPTNLARRVEAAS
jgi:hypothetical protein